MRNQKHSLQKARNRIQRKGDLWYNKEFLMKLRLLGKKEVKEQINENIQ